MEQLFSLPAVKVDALEDGTPKHVNKQQIKIHLLVRLQIDRS